MSAQSSSNSVRFGLVWGLPILGAFLIVAALVWAMRHYTQPPPLNADRAAQRANALRELRADELEALHTTAWLDRSKGIVRLPIRDAMNLLQLEWQDPAEGRSNLIARVEKAFPPPPPPPPPKPNPFE